MQERLILIAEDDQDAIESWQRDVKSFNENPSRTIHFVAEFARSKRRALGILDRVRVNCAAIDLRLPDDEKDAGHKSNDPLGNNILEEILAQVGIPAVVYSGHTKEVSELVKASKIRIIQKHGGGAMESLQWLAEHESLMSAMEATRKQIAHQSANLFSQSIWPRWEKDWKEMTTPGLLDGVLTRQIASHIAESLSLPPHLCHPEEFYIVPPLATDRLNTGDLVSISKALDVVTTGSQGNTTTATTLVYVVVTPRCNMARDTYPNNIILALCRPMDGILKGMRDRFLSGDRKREESATKDLHILASQGHTIASHFLPHCGGLGPWIVDFKEISTVSSDQVTELLKSRFASVAPQFVPNLVQRYAAYQGRIGQPDLDCEMLRLQICK